MELQASLDPRKYQIDIPREDESIDQTICLRFDSLYRSMNPRVPWLQRNTERQLEEASRVCRICILQKVES